MLLLNFSNKKTELLVFILYMFIVFVFILTLIHKFRIYLGHENKHSFNKYKCTHNNHNRYIAPTSYSLALFNLFLHLICYQFYNFLDFYFIFVLLGRLSDQSVNVLCIHNLVY